MSEALKQLAQEIEAKRPDSVVSWEVAFGELAVTASLSSLVDFVEFLKTDSNCRFSSLVDITAVDHPDREERFDLVYHFLSMYQNQRIRLKVAVREDDIVPSIIEVHPSANWFEREVFDMFGISFEGHPDMTRILMPEDWVGHPLRKDYEFPKEYHGISWE